MISRALVASLTLVTAGSLGCAHEHASLARTPVGQTRLTASEVPARPGIAVSPDILAACKLHFDDTQSAPEFCFDQTYLTPPDRDVLEKVAVCLTTGPLKGRSIHLVGRADPRGEEEYNMTLGSSRAGSVANYLGLLGVDSSRITQTSRGKLDATGTNEETWQLDRRVDVLLVP